MNHELEAWHERLMLDEIAFWGIHRFHEVWWGIACGRCGWYYHEAIHTGGLDAPY